MRNGIYSVCVYVPNYLLALSFLLHLHHCLSELSATRENLETLKSHHEALQRSSTKAINELQQRLQLVGEEAARSRVALNMEKNKVSAMVYVSLCRTISYIL